MDYWHELSVPKSTPVGSPVREVMALCPGVVKEVMLFFPKGHRGTTHCRIKRFETQVWPSTPEAWYLGDGTVIEFPESYRMVGKPFEVILEGYNTDSSNPHTVYVRITILEEEARILGPLPPVSVYEELA